jgi:hypothetical protein
MGMKVDTVKIDGYTGEGINGPIFQHVKGVFKNAPQTCPSG